MATVNKDFKVKNGLIVEGTTGTINNFAILTKKQADQDYIIDLIGGTATPDNTPDTVVKRDENGDFSAGEITADIIGDVTGTVSDISNHDTDDLGEGAINKYFTTDRAKDAAGAALVGGTQTNISVTYDNVSKTFSFVAENGVDDSTTDDLEEGENNLYYTDQRVDDYINASIDTDDVSEGTTNKYYTDTRARNAVSDGDGLNYNSSTGVFSAHLGNGLEIGAGGEIQIDDLVVVTETDLTNAITAHDVTSGVHGVTGNVVGTTDTQTLSNKTLGSNLDADGYTITNVATPTNSTDAANKAYVDAVSEGLHVHQAARVATTSNVSIATQLEAGDVVDGVTLVAGDRVLVKNQNVPAENGIYVVQNSGAANRASDFDTAAEVKSGDFIFVTSGNTYASTGWVQTNMPAIIGTDPIAFTQFSGAGTYSAGNGLNLDGTVFEIDESVTATVTYVDTELGLHSDATSGVHGVTGNVVGTTDSQTLTNKALGASTTLAANLDAAGYKVSNLEDPSANQDAATKYYVDNAITGAGGDLTAHANATTGIHGVTGNIVGTSDSQTLTNKTIDGSSNTLSNIANGSLVNDSITINGYETELGSSVTLNTSDVAEGTNLYYTDSRAQSAMVTPLTTGTQTNISVTYNALTESYDFVAENGVADSTTADLAEDPDGSGTSGTWYFTDARAVSALQAVTPNFTEVELNSVAKQVAATLSAPTAGVQSAYLWDSAEYRSAEFLVKVAYGSHTEVSKVILTLDTTNNIAITEYAIVGTNGSASSISANMSGTDVVLQVTTVNNNSTVTVVGTLLA